MTAPATLPGLFYPEPWHDLPEQDTPITARRLSRVETAVAEISAALRQIITAGTVGRQLLAAETDQQARAILQAASVADLAGKVTSVQPALPAPVPPPITGLYWSANTPTVASLASAGVPSGTLVASPNGLVFYVGGALLPVGLSSGSAVTAAALPSAVGTLTVVARVSTGGVQVAYPTAQGFLTATVGAVTSTGGNLARTSAAGTLTATASVSFGGTYADTYSDTYGAPDASATGFGATGFGSSGFGE